MIGAITGDVVGSIYEFNNLKSKEFELFGKHSRFTDDTVLSVAVADCILTHGNNTPKEAIIATFKKYAKLYPHSGFGGMFRKWVFSKEDLPAYNSFGNGSAMRISPVGWAFDSREEVKEQAIKFTEVTHNHPEGIKGAVVTATSIYVARCKPNNPDTKYLIKALAEAEGYKLDKTCDQIRPDYKFNETCQETVPQAIQAFLESTSFEDAIRLAVSLGGDSDTLACITGGIAEAYYNPIPMNIGYMTLCYLHEDLRDVVLKFHNKYVYKG